MIFVDTGVWYEANAERGDLADRLRALLEQHAGKLATSAPILTELWALVAVRKNAAGATATCLDVAAHADVLQVERDDHERALAILRKWPDQSFSYADATSFALMVRERIDRVATLDHHFGVYRYGRRRDQAFHLVN